MLWWPRGGSERFLSDDDSRIHQVWLPVDSLLTTGDYHCIMTRLSPDDWLQYMIILLVTVTQATTVLKRDKHVHNP